jgi:hypothetical protein
MFVVGSFATKEGVHNLEVFKPYKIQQNLYIFKIFIFTQKKFNTSNVIYWDNYKYFEEHVAKKILQKILFMKKSKC